jgi:ABC-type multidrug transport system fused ATPase/permease subunit
MNLAWAVLITAVVTAAAVGAMLLVRRRAPEGSYFADGDRAAGVFGVLATGFAVLLGLVVVLAFTSYDESKSGADAEAILTRQLFENAQFMPDSARPRLSGQVICYGRFVVFDEWPRLEEGKHESEFNPWGVRLFRTTQSVDPRTPSEQAAFSKWLDQISDTEHARTDRIHGAQGVIPSPLWVVLFLTGGVIFVFILFFADSGERAVSQAMLMGSVAVVVAVTLILLWFLDNPYHGGFGSLQPVGMERTLDSLDEERRIVGLRGPLPCDDEGHAR